MPPALRAVANAAADQSGMTVGDWICEAIAAYSQSNPLQRPSQPTPRSTTSVRALTYAGGAQAATAGQGAVEGPVDAAAHLGDEATEAVELIAEWEDPEADARRGPAPWSRRPPPNDYGWAIQDIHQRLTRVETRRQPFPLGGIFRRRS